MNHRPFNVDEGPESAGIFFFFIYLLLLFFVLYVVSYLQQSKIFRLFRTSPQTTPQKTKLLGVYDVHVYMCHMRTTQFRNYSVRLAVCQSHFVKATQTSGHPSCFTYQGYPDI